MASLFPHYFGQRPENDLIGSLRHHPHDVVDSANVDLFIDDALKNVDLIKFILSLSLSLSHTEVLHEKHSD